VKQDKAEKETKIGISSGFGRDVNPVAQIN